MSPAPSRRCRPAHPRGLPRLNAIVVFSAMALAAVLALPTAGAAQEAGLEPLRQGVHFSIGVGGMRAIVEDDFVVAQTDTFNSQFGIGFDIEGLMGAGKQYPLTPPAG